MATVCPVKGEGGGGGLPRQMEVNFGTLGISKIFSNIVAGTMRDRSTGLWLC